MPRFCEHCGVREGSRHAASCPDIATEDCGGGLHDPEVGGVIVDQDEEDHWDTGDLV